MKGGARRVGACAIEAPQTLSLLAVGPLTAIGVGSRTNVHICAVCDLPKLRPFSSRVYDACSSCRRMNEIAARPATTYTRNATPRWDRQMLNKVPEITLYFWIIKILCTTVGETAADSSHENLGLGLIADDLHRSAVAGHAWCPVPSGRYIPADLLAGGRLDQRRRHAVHGQPRRQSRRRSSEHDGLCDRSRVPFLCLVQTEHTLSIHTISTIRREAFYWLAILFTFALGTSAGDLVSERLNVGYWVSALLFGLLIALVTFAHLRFGMNDVLSFWIAYMLTRPLGASIGDELSQPVPKEASALARRRRASSS